MNDKPKEESVKSTLKTVIFLTLWCYLNHFYLIDLLNFSQRLVNATDAFDSRTTYGSTFRSFCLGYVGYVELGEKITDENSLSNTLIRISPLSFHTFW